MLRLETWIDNVKRSNQAFPAYMERKNEARHELKNNIGIFEDEIKDKLKKLQEASNESKKINEKNANRKLYNPIDTSKFRDLIHGLRVIKSAIEGKIKEIAGLDLIPEMT